MKKILRYYVVAFMFLFPIFLLPGVTGVFSFGKNWFLMVSALLGLVLWVAKMLLTKNITVKSNKALGVMFLVVLWGLINWWRGTPDLRARGFLDNFGLGTLLALFTWLFLWIQVYSPKQKRIQIWALTAGGVLAGLVSVAVFLIPEARLPLNIPTETPLVSINKGWSLTGSLISEAVLFLFLVLNWGKKLMRKLKRKEGSFVVEGVITAVFTLVFGIAVYKIVTLGWVVLPMFSSWVIAVEVLKLSPLWGVGLANFSRAFTQLRPTQFNNTPYWANSFSGPMMGGLQIWSELGLPGLILVLWMVSRWLKAGKENKNFWLVGLFLGLVLLTPLNLMVVWLLVWLVAGRFFETKEHRLVLVVGENKFNVLPWVTGGLMVILSVFGIYSYARILMGEVYLRNSLVAASKNDGVKTYEMQIKAIAMNPNLARYRRVYSQTNLALAQGILANEELSDDDKQRASVLIQQAAREAKAAVSLDQGSATAWSNLAAIYRALIGVVDGAADWAFQAYQQAIALDPVNPSLKLDLGGLLYGAGRYAEADRVFEEAVINKQDFANAWYNWAYTAKQLNRLGDAVSRMSQAVALVPGDSGDFEAASNELAKWKEEYDQALAQLQAQQQQAAAQQEERAPETLTTPEPLPTAGEEEVVNVPAEELEPPQAELPSPTPTEVLQEEAPVEEQP